MGSIIQRIVTVLNNTNCALNRIALETTENGRISDQNISLEFHREEDGMGKLGGYHLRNYWKNGRNEIKELQVEEAEEERE